MKKEELKALVNKIQSMSAREIILAMVDSLRNPVTKIDMSTFGMKDTFGNYGNEGICYGCAATNTICKLGGFDPSIVLDSKEKRTYVSIHGYESDEVIFFKSMISGFEISIDYLRKGDIMSYNSYASKWGFSLIKGYDIYFSYLPHLHDSFTEYQLQQYEDFANTL